MASARLAVARAAAARWRPPVRPYSVPERLGLAGLAAAAAVAGFPAVSSRTGLYLPCPLRTLTGVPCPMCGMTTAATQLAAGDLTAASAANPAILLLAGLTAVMAVLVAARSLSLAPPPVPWSAGRCREARRVAALLAVASWVFQLHRLDWI